MFIVLMSMAFTHFHDSFDGKIFSGAAIIFVLVPISIFLLDLQGIWLDFALPLLVIEYHHLVMEVKGEPKKGISSVLVLVIEYHHLVNEARGEAKKRIISVEAERFSASKEDT